jgi:uracil-DNA glycosylase
MVEPKKPTPSSPRASMSAMRRQAEACRRCDLWKHATQTVFGAGPRSARIMFVGEQPGDAEDIEGEPFVGPAGKLLRHALEDAGIDLRDVYLTNVVKHFKWEARGKRRIHKKPRHSEVQACRVWLDAEIAMVKPRAIVALGATAAQALLGPGAKVTRDRTKSFPSPLAPFVTLTVHPSSILRAPDDEARKRAYADFVQDLRVIAGVLD